MRGKRQSTTSVPPMGAKPRDIIEIITPNYGVLDKPILRTGNVAWELYNSKSGNDYKVPHKNMRRDHVILLDSHWSSITGNH